jgi:putative hydrolase of the HAD superfamily
MLIAYNQEQMHTIEAVLFDYGMVLSGPPLPSAWERMKAITGLDEPSFHAGYWEYRHAYDRGTHTGVEYWHLVAGHSGVKLDDGQVAQLINADNDLWTERNEPMIAWAQRLQKAGVRTGILSNLGDEMNAGLLKKFGWIAAFDHCTWSHRLKLAKPELEIYQHAIEGLKAPAERILFIDDRADNIAGARAAGLQTLRYISHEAFEQEMLERGFSELLYAGV